MYSIIVSPRFKRAYKRFVRNYPYLQNNIDYAINKLSEDPFAPLFNLHKLSGDLYELYACKYGYDCRIISSIDKSTIRNSASVLLVDIGTHRDLY